MKHKKKILLILGLCIFILALVGLSYALWVVTLEQHDENEIATACLDVEIMKNEGKGINLDPGYPMLDKEGEALTPYTFSIHNKCQDNVKYQVNLEIINTSSLDPKYIKVKLNEENEKGSIEYLKEEVDSTLTNADKAYKLGVGYLKNNETKKFEFRQWMDGDTEVTDENPMNKNFHSKITIIATYLTADKLPPNPTLDLSTEYGSTIIANGKISESIKKVSKYEYRLNNGNWEEGGEFYRFSGLTNGTYNVDVRITDNDGFVSDKMTEEIQINDENQTTQTIMGKEFAVTTGGNGLYEVKHEDLTNTINESFNTMEYRFGGEDPNNYVWFNDELWRIIGLVNVMTNENKVEQRIKIIRDTVYKESIDFQGTDETINSFWWGTYEDKIDLNTTYYYSLEPSTKDMIDESLYWNVGWIIEYDASSPYNASEYYSIERSSNTHNDVPYLWSSTGNEKARIGLMYPSDYGYAVGGEDSNRESCANEAIDNWENECYEKNWLYSPKFPRATMNFLTMKYYVPSGEYYEEYEYLGYMSIDCKSDSCATLPSLQPVVYLKQNVKIVNDNKTTGSRTNPFMLSFE